MLSSRAGGRPLSPWLPILVLVGTCSALLGVKILTNFGTEDRGQLNRKLTLEQGWTRISQCVSRNSSVWLGGAWILLGQCTQRFQSVVPFEYASGSGQDSSRKASISPWQILSDVLLVGLLLTLHRPTGGDLDDRNNDRGDNKGHSKLKQLEIERNVAKHRFLETIEANLGLPTGAHSHSTGANQVPPTTALESLHSEQPVDSSNSVRPERKQHQQTQQRYLEVLVHNVSHTDLILSLDAPPIPRDSGTKIPDVDETYCLCRPRFSAFDAYSRKVLATLNKSATNLHSKLISSPRYERSDVDNRKIQLSNSIGKGGSANNQLPIGFSLQPNSGDSVRDSPLSVSCQELNDLRVRGRDAPRVVQLENSTTLNAVFFPLLAMLLPQWEAKLEEKYQANTKCKKVLVLVSGVGTPRNWTHSVNGNSTQVCAQLMESFIKTLYPDWVVVQVFSETNIFRYDENISFVQNELMPCIQSYRDAHAKGLPYPDEVTTLQTLSGSHANDDRPFDEDWGKTMSLTLSFADGSPARNHAIQAALRPYKPTYFHCWQLKTFWHESKIVDSDIEVHSFEDMETLPPVDISSGQLQQKPLIMQVVSEMKAFKAEMEAILRSGSHDIQKFWLRKTHKPVLAVLAVQPPNGAAPKMYRGTNMEVSMPTGSLCAERNVIGTALADNPALKRHHLKLIAVLSVPNPLTIVQSSSMVSLPTSGRTSRSSSLDVPGPSMTLKPPKPPSRSNSGDIGDWLVGDGIPAEGSTKLGAVVNATPPNGPIALPDTQPTAISLSETIEAISPSTPARRISLYQNYTQPNNNKHAVSNRHKSTKKTVVVHSHGDLNPLRPCGACNEWLKKIAETNPYFQILTFTDAECNGVYCTPCSE